MSRFNFRDPTGKVVAADQWLRTWSERFPTANYNGYEELIAKHHRFSASDFEEIGRWKDAAKTDGRWKPNVASVAYLVWIQAAKERPRCPETIAWRTF